MSNADTALLHPESSSIGYWPAEFAMTTLRSVGDDESAQLIDDLVAAEDNNLTAATPVASFISFFPSEHGIWSGTATAFGFIKTGAATSDEPLRIDHAGNIEPETSLKGKQIKVTLDRLRAADYPGKGVHQVLVEFSGKHQVKDNPQQLRFAQTYPVEEAAGAGIIGYPMFLGLSVGGEGVAFAASTRNVENNDDKQLLGMLDSDVMKSGLKLLKTAQPAIAPLTDLATMVGKAFARRHENILVQNFFMGLDFEATPARARLALGSYIAVQLPANHQLNWSDWVYDQRNGRFQRADRPDVDIPYNYLVFSVSEYDE
ncbi:MAG: hypothetical protein V7607_2561 [Solirubrobacteraceae bacterium]